MKASAIRKVLLIAVLFLVASDGATAGDTDERPDRWRELIRTALADLEKARYPEAERGLHEALREAGDSVRRQEITLRALVAVYSDQKKIHETREFVGRLLRLADAFTRPEDRDVARGYRNTARFLLLAGIRDEAAALFIGTRRLETVTGQTTCGGTAREQEPTAKLSPAEREKPVKAVEALGAFSEWANGRAGKDKPEYLTRLMELEALVGAFRVGSGDKLGFLAQGQPAGSINAALSCFEDAVGLWPGVAEVWTSGERWVREAARALGMKSPGERREEEEQRQAELRRAGRAAAQNRESNPGSSSTPASPEVLRRALPALQRLQSMTRAGLTYRDYVPLVAETRATLDRVVRETGGSPGPLEEALVYYSVAASAWQFKIEDSASPLGDNVLIRYLTAVNVPCPAMRALLENEPARGAPTSPQVLVMAVPTLWSCASAKIDEAEMRSR